MHFTPRPTIYNGIPMRSRLEARFAAWLDRQEFQWDYEPQCFAAKDGRQYLPDFRIRDHAPADWCGEEDGKANLYIELKPLADQVDLLELAHIIWWSEPTAHLLYVCPGQFRPSGYIDAPLAVGSLMLLDEAMVFRCDQCDGTTICAAFGSWRCLRCGRYDGNGHHVRVTDSPWWEDAEAS